MNFLNIIIIEEAKRSVVRLWNNDSTYRGKAINNEFYFLSPIAQLADGEDEYSRHWVYMSEDLKAGFQNFIKNLNKDHNLPLPIEDEFTSYDNPDYLWLSYELENLRRAYNKTMINPYTKKVFEGRKFIPYIQLCLKSTAFSIDSLYPKSTLNTYGVKYKPHYVVEFQQPFLKAFINFVCRVFDDNPQRYIEIAGKKIITHQYKAPIYRLAPFDKYFDCRHDLPAIIISKAVEMLLAHEMSHIGGGHLDLNAKDKVFEANIDNIIAEEDDADCQGVCWVLGSRILESDDPKLDISYDDYAQELALSIFSVYLLYTWTYSKEEREWNDKTIENYGHKDHLPYQLRAYNMIGVSLTRCVNLGKWCEQGEIITSDGKPLGSKFFHKAFDEALAMISSFEHSLHMFFARTEKVYELSLDDNIAELLRMSVQEENESCPELKKENIPWLLGFEPQGQAELKRVNDLWKYVRERLVENGAYCKLRPYQEWQPITLADDK